MIHAVIIVGGPIARELNAVLAYAEDDWLFILLLTHPVTG